jgi:hypothetical protein
MGSIDLSVVIMAHPFRAPYVEQLEAALDPDAVVFDARNDRWDTGRRALGAYREGASHVLVVQDDAILSRDLPEAAARCAELAGDRPVSFYTGGTRPNQKKIVPAARRAHRLGASWIAGIGPWWGVAVMVPVAHVPDVISWGDSNSVTQNNYDLRIAGFYQEAQIPCWYSFPSLVDHRSAFESPSLVPGRDGLNRRALWFIGENRSGTEIDWGAGVVGMADKVRFRHTRRGTTNTASEGSSLADRLESSGVWEREPDAPLERLAPATKSPQKRT